MRRFLRDAARWLGLLAAAYLGAVAIRGSRLLTRPQVRVLLPETDGAPATPADLGLAYEDVIFATDDGVVLDGWLIPAARDTAAAVVLLHGFGGNRLPELAAFVPWLQREYNVLQFDFRGHGRSPPGSTTLGGRERRDTAAAVRFLSERGMAPIALMGVSMGGANAILAAPDLPVSAVVADSPYAQIHHPIASRLRERRYPLSALAARVIVGAGGLRTRTRLPSPLSAVARIAPRALLLIAPREDRLISWRQSALLHRAAGEPKELWVVDGAEHADAYRVAPAEYERRVLDFLARYLRVEAASAAPARL